MVQVPPPPPPPVVSSSPQPNSPLLQDKVLLSLAQSVSPAPKKRFETYILVVVAFVPVALLNVKFCSVEEPVTRRLESEVRPPVAVRVPVKLAAEEMVWPLISPEVIVPEEIMFPVLSRVENRFVLEAVSE